MLNESVQVNVAKNNMSSAGEDSRERKYFIRSEGNRNTSNDMYYTGSKAIFLDHRYKRIIREQRCLVLADAFIINIDTKPYLVYLKDQKRPFDLTWE